MKEKNNEITVCEENKNGCDYIVGDIHGNDKCFEKVLDSLKNNDRLFLVGDLTDRGKDSFRVIRLILKIWNKARVFAVRGNHEQECLETIECLEVLAEKNGRLIHGKKSDESLKKLDKYIRRDNESDNEKIKEIIRNLSDYKELKNHYEDLIWHLTNDRKWLAKLFIGDWAAYRIDLEDKELVYSHNSDVKCVKDYMSQLPYIIRVEGKHPFQVVHADMPVEDDVLADRIKHNTGLSATEKKYAMWARENDSKTAIRTENRNPKSVITYVGHNIIEGNKLPIVRYDSNTVDIDVAMYDINASLVVNHTRGHSFFLGDHKKVTKDLRNKKEMLNDHLKELFPKNTSHTDVVIKKRKTDYSVNKSDKNYHNDTGFVRKDNKKPLSEKVAEQNKVQKKTGTNMNQFWNKVPVSSSHEEIQLTNTYRS